VEELICDMVGGEGEKGRCLDYQILKVGWRDTWSHMVSQCQCYKKEDFGSVIKIIH